MKHSETLGAMFRISIENSSPSAVLRDVQSVHDVNELLKPHDSVVEETDPQGSCKPFGKELKELHFMIACHDRFIWLGPTHSHSSSGIQWVVLVGLISPANPDPSERRTRKCTRWVDPIARETPHPQCPESDETATENQRSTRPREILSQCWVNLVW